MADEADLGNETAEKTLSSHLARVRAAARSSLSPAGRCYNCDEELRSSMLFCDGHCRDDYTKRETARRRNG